MPKKIIAAMVRHFDDRRKFIAWSAVAAILCCGMLYIRSRQFRMMDATYALVDELQEKDYSDPLNLRWLLDKMGFDKVFPSPKPRDKRKIADELIAIGPLAVPELIETLKCDKLSTRIFAVYALGEIGDLRAVEPLIKNLQDKNWDVRAFSLYALGKIGDPRALRAIIMMARDLGDVKDNYTDVNARDVYFSLTPDKPWIQHFIDALQDREKWVRIGAADALGWIGDARTIDPLTEAMKDEDKDVRQAVKLAIDRIRLRPGCGGR